MLHIFSHTKTKVDIWLLGLVGLLFMSGMIMLYSASTVESLERFGNTTHFIKNQLLQGGLLGVLVLFVCSKIDYRLWQRLVPLVVGGSLLLLLLVKVPGVGFSAGGASRWIHIGPAFFQPAELAKLAIVMYSAAWMANRRQHLHNFMSGIFPLLAIVALFSILILWQPDFGTMLVLLGAAFMMLVAAGTPWRWIAAVVAAGGVLLLLLIWFEPYRAARLFTFLNPEHDLSGAGYQVNQALMAVGSGGVWGLGYGQSRQKHNFLPEVLGDSIFPVIAEELGYVRVLGIIGLFLAFMARGMRVALAAPDHFGRLLAAGLTSLIMVQVFINIGASIGLLPLTGIPLPFFSYGSSSLIVTMAACGILLQISKHSKLHA
ncbi:MAG: putative lipid II flippase FtsW [Candidatus Doudnabacteria bacterium]|nr:putative lipid II flippase FtsW [Candidatus Doudnabacteria bacterium]